MAGLPTLQTASLGSTPGSSGSRGPRKRRAEQPGMQGPAAQPSQPSGTSPGQPPTFAQLQASGVARPAPPSAQMPQTPQTPGAQMGATATAPGAIPQYRGSQQATQVRGQLQGAVTQALNAPSRYDTPAFTSIRDAAYADLNNQFARIRDTTNTDLARRGLSASTIGGNALYDVDSAQSRAMGDLNATLLKDAAATQASDRSQAYGMGSDLAGLAGSQDLAGYTANANTTNQNVQNTLAQTLGLGNLAVNQGALTGMYNGQQTLGAQQLAQSGSQFDKSYGLQSQQADLAKTLGLGNLDLQKESLAQSGSQFDKSYGLQSQQADLAKTLGLGNLDLQKESLAQSGSQFDKSYGLQQQQADLAKTLGLGNLDLQGKSLAQSGSQFGQDLALRQQQADASNDLAKATLAQSGSQFDKSYGLQSEAQQTQQQQFAQNLAQTLGISQMQNDTSNRGITAQQSVAQSDLLYKLLATMTNMSADQIKKLVGGLGTTSSPPPRPVPPSVLPPQQIAEQNRLLGLVG